MSEGATVSDNAEKEDLYRTPEQEQAAAGVGTPGAYEMELAEINPVNAHLFKENRWADHFARLRAARQAKLGQG